MRNTTKSKGTRNDYHLKIKAITRKLVASGEPHEVAKKDGVGRRSVVGVTYLAEICFCFLSPLGSISVDCCFVPVSLLLTLCLLLVS